MILGDNLNLAELANVAKMASSRCETNGQRCGAERLLGRENILLLLLRPPVVPCVCPLLSSTIRCLFCTSNMESGGGGGSELGHAEQSLHAQSHLSQKTHFCAVSVLIVSMNFCLCLCCLCLNLFVGHLCVANICLDCLLCLCLNKSVLSLSVLPLPLSAFLTLWTFICVSLDPSFCGRNLLISVCDQFLLHKSVCRSLHLCLASTSICAAKIGCAQKWLLTMCLVGAIGNAFGAQTFCRIQPPNTNMQSIQANSNHWKMADLLQSIFLQNLKCAVQTDVNGKRIVDCEFGGQ